MASADLRKELECSVCLSLYTDPVILKCGHNFCRACINRVLDTQEDSGLYSCPECREEFPKRPPLQRNIALRNIVENFRSTQPDQEKAAIPCTYCIHSPVPAIKSCLMCEASLCEDHLRVHSKSPEHVLSDPKASLENRKCSIHNKVLEYYCTEDAACICASCCLMEDHKGHQMESLPEASKEKIQKLRKYLQNLKTLEEQVKEVFPIVKERQSKLREKAVDEAETVTALFRNIRRRLEVLEKSILSELSRQAEYLSFSDAIQQLEISKGQFSDKVLEIEELCNLTDPLTVLQKSVSDDLDFRVEKYDIARSGNNHSDVTWIAHTFLCFGLSDIFAGENGGIFMFGPASILLEEDTANNNLHVSDDKKTATKSSKQSRQNKRKRFQSEPQVLSSQTFSSEQHYWEVDVGRSNNWVVGVCYSSIPKKGGESLIGMNSKSWGLDRRGNDYVVRHNREAIELPEAVSSDRVRIYLDYEVGQLSFYDLCEPVRHLHSFSATFTYPLHAAFYVNHGSISV